MNFPLNIVISGGAGFIGSTLVKRLAGEGNRDADLVYHLADVVGGIHFAFGHAGFIFRQNIQINSNVLSACIVNQIRNYIYVGTACSYPKHLQMPAGFTALAEDQTYPAEPESSYEWSKLMGEYEAELAQQSGKLFDLKTGLQCTYEWIVDKMGY